MLLAPGDYPGGFSFRDLQGEPNRPILIASEDASLPTRLVGGGTALQFSGVTYLELRDLVLTGTKANGIDIDDQGSYEKKSHHLVLRRLTVTDVGPEGNRDGIKLSGVDDFLIEGCRVSEWGSERSGADMVGCRRGVLEGNYFGGRPTAEAKRSR